LSYFGICPALIEQGFAHKLIFLFLVIKKIVGFSIAINFKSKAGIGGILSKN
jgi:hypothetical protein